LISKPAAEVASTSDNIPEEAKVDHLDVSSIEKRRMCLYCVILKITQLSTKIYQPKFLLLVCD